jgi:hypothetical protein
MIILLLSRNVMPVIPRWAGRRSITRIQIPATIRATTLATSAADLVTMTMTKTLPIHRPNTHLSAPPVTRTISDEKGNTLAVKTVPSNKTRIAARPMAVTESATRSSEDHHDGNAKLLPGGAAVALLHSRSRFGRKRLMSHRAGHFCPEPLRKRRQYVRRCRLWSAENL